MLCFFCRGASSQTPAGELSALTQSLQMDFMGPLRHREGHGKGRGRRKVKGGRGRKGLAPREK